MKTARWRSADLQNPAQSAKGEERGDRERNPWLAKMGYRLPYGFLAYHTVMIQSVTWVLIISYIKVHIKQSSMQIQIHAGIIKVQTPKTQFIFLNSIQYNASTTN